MNFNDKLHVTRELGELTPETQSQALTGGAVMAATPAIAAGAVITSAVAAFVAEEVVAG